MIFKFIARVHMEEDSALVQNHLLRCCSFIHNKTGVCVVDCCHQEIRGSTLHTTHSPYTYHYVCWFLYLPLLQKNQFDLRRYVCVMFSKLIKWNRVHWIGKVIFLCSCRFQFHFAVVILMFTLTAPVLREFSICADVVFEFFLIFRISYRSTSFNLMLFWWPICT